MQLISDPIAGIPAIEPPQQPTKLLDRLLATRVSLIVKETIADRPLQVWRSYAWRLPHSGGVLNTTPYLQFPYPMQKKLDN
jgi:hypothetical protein